MERAAAGPAGRVGGREAGRQPAYQVGDRLTFSVAGQNREVQVQSLRKVKWDNFQPNFFMVFQPGT